MTRRTALRRGALALTATTILGAQAPASASAAKRTTGTTTDGMLRARFEPYAGTPVQLAAGQSEVRGTFVAVEDLVGVAGLKGSQDAYALRFRAPLSFAAGQQTISVASASFGTVDLFVTPAGTSSRTRDYVGIVNRVVPS